MRRRDAYSVEALIASVVDPPMADRAWCKPGLCYRQALYAEVAGKGVYAGMLYIGAAIKNSAFHAEMEKAEAAGDPVWETPAVDPGHLAGLLWTMHGTKGQREVIYPSIACRGSVP